LACRRLARRDARHEVQQVEARLRVLDVAGDRRARKLCIERDRIRRQQVGQPHVGERRRPRLADEGDVRRRVLRAQQRTRPFDRGALDPHRLRVASRWFSTSRIATCWRHSTLAASVAASATTSSTVTIVMPAARAARVLHRIFRVDAFACPRYAGRSRVQILIHASNASHA
jgi:hypothetical protein